MSQLPASGSPPPIPQPAPPVMPYATPVAFENVATVLREGPVLIVPKEVSLPDLCVKCNASAGGFRLRKRLSWHPSWVIVLVFVNLLVYLIVALVMRKTARVEMGLCPLHQTKRRNTIIISWLWFLVSLATLIGGIVLTVNARPGEEWPVLVILAGALLLLACGVYAILGVPVLTPKRIDERFAWLKGAGPDFLSSFPAVQRA